MSKVQRLITATRKFAECQYNIPQPNKTEPTNVDALTAMRFIQESLVQLLVELYSAHTQKGDIFLAYCHLSRIEDAITDIAYITPSRTPQPTSADLAQDIETLKRTEEVLTYISTFLTAHDNVPLQMLGECLKRMNLEFRAVAKEIGSLER